MPNIAIYKPGSDKIKFFIDDAIRTPRGVSSSLGGSVALNRAKWGFVWTNDSSAKIDGKWDKKVSELTPCESGAEVFRTDKRTYRRAVERRADLAGMTYSQLDNHIDKIKGMAEVKVYLKKLSRVVLAIIQMQDRED